MALALGLVGFAGVLSAQGTGQVTGRAVVAEGTAGLEGAEVRVAGTSIATLTGQDGRFLLTRVPAGRQVLQVSYLGRETQRVDVAVRAGEGVTVDVSMPVEAIGIEGIEVLGVRAWTQAAALSRQKNAPNIINVVASDQIGRFPDASAPEALQRVPGITVERDQGEGRYVNIRGGAAEFTNININGATVPSPEGDERQVALDAVPVDILESIEVTKALTPDMDASAIGGSVNLVTRRAPEVPTLSFDLGGGYAPIREEPSYEGALSYGQRFSDGKLGMLLSGSYSTRDFGSDDIEPEYDLGQPGTADDELVEFQTRHYSLTRERIGGTAAFDYRASSTSRIQLTGSYAQHEDIEQRRILNNLVEDGELSYEHKNRLEQLEIASATLSGDHVLGGGVQLDYGVSLSRSAEDTPYDTEIFFLREGVTFNPDLSDPHRIRPNPDAAALAGSFAFDGFEDGSSITTSVDRIAHVDLDIPYQLGGYASGGLEFGFSIRERVKDQDVTEAEYELTDGELILGEDIGSPFDISGFNPGRYEFPGNSTTPDEVKDFVRTNTAVLESETDVEADTEDYDLSERVIAGYVMTELNVSPRLMILPGLRYEYTDFESDGFEFDPETETVSPTSGDKSYGSVFPHVHLRYRMSDQTNLRAAFSSAIARPNFFSLVPYRIPDDRDVELGNPDLDPTTSRNFDMLVEHYDERIGVVSAGGFYKTLNDPIFFFVSVNDQGGETVQPANGESADIRGVEVALQQQLTFLPSPFDGLGFYGNYTFTDSEATLPGGRTAKLAGQADHTFNLALSYERSGFSGQLSLNQRDAYVDEYGEEEAEDIFVGSRHQLDFSANYRVGRAGALYVELLNLTNQPFILYQGVEDRPRQQEYYQPWGVIGVRLNR